MASSVHLFWLNWINNKKSNWKPKIWWTTWFRLMYDFVWVNELMFGDFGARIKTPISMPAEWQWAWFAVGIHRKPLQQQQLYSLVSKSSHLSRITGLLCLYRNLTIKSYTVRCFMRSVEASLLHTVYNVASRMHRLQPSALHYIVNECQNNFGQVRLTRFGHSIFQLTETWARRRGRRPAHYNQRATWPACFTSAASIS